MSERRDRGSLAGLPDRYVDLGPLGRGAMGEVRRVQDRLLGIPLALKLLRKDRADEASLHARLLREARVTASLQHPGIVPVHDLGTLDDGRSWFTMREVGGQTLDVVFCDGRGPTVSLPGGSGWSLRRLITVFHRICETLSAAHDRGIVHRDLKPSNVMVGERGEVFVMDWGLAKVLDGQDHSDRTLRDASTPLRWADDATLDQQPELDLDDETLALEFAGSWSSEQDEEDDGIAATVAGTILGTPPYMSPEQARGETARVDRRSDVYCLGALLHEILTGQPPYDARGRRAWLAILDAPPRTLTTEDHPTLDPGLLDIANRALAREASDRLADAGALAAEVQSWLDGELARRQADAHVTTAEDHARRCDELRQESLELQLDASRRLAAFDSRAVVDEKRDAWELEDRANALALDADTEEARHEQRLLTALNFDPEHARAHDLLASHHRRRLIEAEGRRDVGAAAQAEVRLRAHDRGQHAAWLQGDGALSLRTEPSGAEVRLHEYVSEGRRLVPVFRRLLGRTPLTRVSLPRGSYLLELEAPGCATTRYPVSLGRQEHWDGCPPDSSVPAVIPLLRRDELGADDCHVPAGWFQAGGDDDAADALPAARCWRDDFIIRRHPVTNREYLEFLNDLWHADRLELAWSHAPREAHADAEGSDSSRYAFDDRRGFTLDADTSGPPWTLDMPVRSLSWLSAMSYCRWLSDTTGLPWTLPHELDWEKAARGVDGRSFPFGDHLEPSWACYLHSHSGAPGPMEVDEAEHDVSPHGVRGVTGNVRQWCRNPYRESDAEEALESGDDDPTIVRVVRGGSWSSLPHLCRPAGRFGAPAGDRLSAVGLRLARPLLQREL